ncbi:hypothetical protein KKQ11_25300, partial [Pseudomonas sp. MG-2]|nr:hypothetical protein [Pseudomonas sp. MG-2]
LSERTKTLIGHVHRSAFALFAGQQVTPLRVSLTVGEYMSLLNEALEARTDAFLQQVDKQFRDPLGRKVRAMVLSGAINIAAAGNRSQMIEVMLWTLESAESLQARLVQLREGAAGGVGALVRNVAIGAGTLRAQVTGGLKISSTAAQSVASDAMRSLRDAAASSGSVKLLLALGGIWFQQDSLGKNYRALQETHQNNPEALAAIWSSSLGLLGVSVEAAGLAVTLVRPKIPWPRAVTTTSLGTGMARYGAGIAAIAGMMDGAQYLFASLRTHKSGDLTSADRYRTAGIMAGASAIAGVLGAFGPATLFGPIGIAIILGLAAYAIASEAKQNESSPTELWARQSRWGLSEDNRLWTKAKHLDIAIGALNAAAIGVQAEISIITQFTSHTNMQTSEPKGMIIGNDPAIPAEYTLNYYFLLPNYAEGTSRHEWHLSIHRTGAQREIITVSGDSTPTNQLQISLPKGKGVFGHIDNPKPLVRFNNKSSTLTIQGALPLLVDHHINAIEFSLHYWPDKQDELGHAHVTITENYMHSLEPLTKWPDPY